MNSTAAYANYLTRDSYGGGIIRQTEEVFKANAESD